jgi:hypothetical protein
MAVCGHPVSDAKNHDIPAPRAAKIFPRFTCKCGKSWTLARKDPPLLTKRNPPWRGGWMGFRLLSPSA